MEDTLSQLFEPVIASGTPWTAVFGNNDPEAILLKKDWQMEYIAAQPGAIAEAGPAAIHGIGNFVIQVEASESEEVLYNLWMLDSGDYSQVSGVDGYDWVYLDQIQWYSEMSKSLEQQAGKAQIDGLLFMHIPTPEFFDAAQGEIVGDMFEQVAAPRVNSGLLTEMRTRGGENGKPCDPPVVL